MSARHPTAAPVPNPASRRHGLARGFAPGFTRGFTLVELLVVIGIIALLISILMPSLNAARRQARTVQCLSNIRQIGIAYQMYCLNNRGRSFIYRTEDDNFWMEVIRPYNGDISFIGICPEASEPSGGWGSVNRAWGPGTGFLTNKYGSYAFNGWLYRPYRPDPTGLGAGAVYGFGPPEAWIHVQSATEAPRIPTFADSAWVDAWPFDSDSPGDLVTGGAGVVRPEMPRVCLKRHKFAVNVVFLDGHAETVDLPDLWKLKWSNTFRSRDIVIPRR